MKQIICDKCSVPLASPPIIIDLSVGRKVSIPTEFRDNAGFGADICYECLLRSLKDGVEKLRPMDMP